MQVLKYGIKHELLVHPPMPSSVLEEKLEQEGEAEIEMGNEAAGELQSGSDEESR